MKKVTIISFALIVGMCLATGSFAADKDAIKKQVDDIVVAIDGGKWLRTLQVLPKISPTMYS